jgi:hypothetical protein
MAVRKLKPIEERDPYAAAVLDAFDKQEAEKPIQTKCSDGWHGNNRCHDPKHVTTQQGVTFDKWRCDSCGATGWDTWD